MKSNTLEIVNKNGLEYIKFPKLTAIKSISHLFSTRLGGVSTGRYTAMNLSFTNGDSRANVLENYRRLCEAEDIEISHLVLSRQTHTANVKTVTEEHRGIGIFMPSLNDIDGLVTNCPGVALVTQYADCTPLIFCDPVKRVIASAHAGWRGTVKQIGKVTVEKMTKEFGCDKNDIIACIGPNIGKCCYEVDNPVYKEFSSIDYLNLESIITPKEKDRYMLDLTEANRQILIHAGIKPQNMDISDLCTCCNHDELHSHRATNGQRGNLAAIIELKKN